MNDILLKSKYCRHHEKIFFFLILAFISFNIQALGQTKEIDSLHQVLNKTKKDIDKIATYLKLSDQFTTIDISKKIEYARKSKAIAEKYKLEEDIIKSDIEIGSAYVLTDVKDSAVYYFTKAFESSKIIKSDILAGRASLNLGYLYERLDAHDIAIERYNTAISFFKNSNYLKGLGQTYINIGSIYFNNQLYSQAKEYFLESLNYNFQSKDQVVMANSYYALGATYKKLGNIELAKDYFEKSYVIRKKMNDHSGIALYKWGIGEIKLLEGKYQEALELSLDGYHYFKKMHNLTNSATILYTVANCYLMLENISEAKKATQEIFEIGNLQDSNNLKLISSELFAKIAIEENDYKNATKYLEESLMYKNMIDADSSIGNVLLMDLVRIKDDAKNLLREKEISDYQNSEYFKIIIIISLSMIIMIVLSLMLLKRNNEKKEINKELLTQKEEILKTNQINVKINEELAQLNEIKNNLMTIISHDVKSPLSNLSILFQMYRTKQLTQAELEEIFSQIERTVIDTRTFLDNVLEWSKNQIDGLVPVPFVFNFSQMIQKNIRLLEVQYKVKGITINNLIQSEAVFVYADPNMIDVVIRNLISNSIKFCSKGDEITLDVISHENYEEFIISDTGIGMSDDQMQNLFVLKHSKSMGTSGEVGHKLGLVLCKNMLDLNNGTIRVESEIGKGSKFCITIPKQKSV